MAVSKQKQSAAANETTLRHVWLAGLGLIAVARKEVVATVNRVAGDAGMLKRRIERAAIGAQANVAEGIGSVRGQVEPVLAEFRLAEFSAEVESRLAPVLVKLGLKPRVKAQRKGRKPVAKKAARRTAARKTAKAAKRVPRKARR